MTSMKGFEQVRTRQKGYSITCNLMQLLCYFSGDKTVRSKSPEDISQLAVVSAFICQKASCASDRNSHIVSFV